MIKILIENARKFNFYQKQRFPILILLVSLFPAVLSSAAIVGAQISLFSFVAALLLSIFYLFHIRVGDEHRDFNHDCLHHKNRPIQKGQITRTQLRSIDIFATVAFLLLVVFFGTDALIIGLIMLLYSYLAEKEFFLGERLRKYFFLYNFINILQMALLQLLIYVIFAGKIPLTYLVTLHFIFTFIGTVIFEFLRKLNVPGADGTGKDTYTWYLGFDKAIFTYIFMFLLDVFFFLQIISFITVNKSTWNLLSIFFLLVSVGFALVCRSRKTLLSNQLMQLSFIMSYSVLNLIIYFLRLH